MKAAQITVYGKPDGIQIRDVPQPVIKNDGILVAIHAAGVNPVDWKILAGYLKSMAPLSFPATLGGDFSGVIVAVGNSVTSFAKGDEVYGSALALGAGSGAFAEYAQVTAQTIAKKPHNFTFKQAAAIPLVGISAIQALTEHIGLQSGQKILIHGGAGGIGSIAIQLAKQLGAYVITTVSTIDIAFAKDLGANEVIDYKTQKFEETLHDIDAVYDTVGGQTYQASFKVLKKGGIIVSMTEQPNADLMHQYGVTAIAQFTKITSERLMKLTNSIESDAITVHIDKEFPLTQTSDAIVYQQSGHPKGKIILVIR